MRVRRVLTATVVLALVAAACGNSPVQTPPATISPSPRPTAAPGESRTPEPTAQPTTVSPVPPTATPAPTLAPTATPLPSSPIVGRMAAVVADTRLVVRSAPGTGSDSTLLAWRLYPGQRVRVEEGPVLASGYTWYRVRVGQIEGWVAAASQAGEPWLAPVVNGVIAFSHDSEYGDVSIINPDGSGERQLVESLFSLMGAIEPGIRLAYQCGQFGSPAAWSHDGTQLLAATFCPGGTFRLNADGSGADVLAAGPGAVWSPDGRSIAFGLYLPEPPFGCPRDGVGPWEIQVIAASGGTARNLTRNAECFFASAPAWSPDGSRIAFTGSDLSRPQNRLGIYVIRADGTGQRRLADGAGPQWSPDGTRIMYASAQPDGVIEVINPDGTGWATFVEGANPLWSPDGTKIAYVVGAGASATMWVMNLIGSEQRKLVDSGASVDWSPDGTQIVFSTGESGQIFIASADGTGARLLTDGCCPVWQPIVLQ